MSFAILPAIDIKSGQCVRLRQGRADQVTVYSADPVAMARHWVAQGACWLHVVDLDGAFMGCPVHTELIGRMAAAIDIPVEVGGGMRTAEDIRSALAHGVARVIVGTRACTEPDAMGRWAAEFGARLAVGIDARDGLVQVSGWTETTQVRATELGRRMAELGVQTIVYTDTATDGMLQGPNVVAMAEMCRATPCSVIASGGVSTSADVNALRRAGAANMCGAIVGKALYEGRVSLPELLGAAADDASP